MASLGFLSSVSWATILILPFPAVLHLCAGKTRLNKASLSPPAFSGGLPVPHLYCPEFEVDKVIITGGVAVARPVHWHQARLSGSASENAG